MTATGIGITRAGCQPRTLGHRFRILNALSSKTNVRSIKSTQPKQVFKKNRQENNAKTTHPTKNKQISRTTSIRQTLQVTATGYKKHNAKQNKNGKQTNANKQTRTNQPTPKKKRRTSPHSSQTNQPTQHTNQGDQNKKINPVFVSCHCTKNQPTYIQINQSANVYLEVTAKPVLETSRSHPHPLFHTASKSAINPLHPTEERSTGGPKGCPGRLPATPHVSLKRVAGSSMLALSRWAEGGRGGRLALDGKKRTSGRFEYQTMPGI